VATIVVILKIKLYSEIPIILLELDVYFYIGDRVAQ